MQNYLRMDWNVLAVSRGKGPCITPTSEYSHILASNYFPTGQTAGAGYIIVSTFLPFSINTYPIALKTIDSYIYSMLLVLYGFVYGYMLLLMVHTCASVRSKWYFFEFVHRPSMSIKWWLRWHGWRRCATRHALVTEQQPQICWLYMAIITSIDLWTHASAKPTRHVCSQ